MNNDKQNYQTWINANWETIFKSIPDTLLKELFAPDSLLHMGFDANIPPRVNEDRTMPWLRKTKRSSLLNS